MGVARDHRTRARASGRAYTIFTKSLSILSEQVETRHLTPSAVQRMLDLCNEFGHKLERNHSQKHQVEFLIRHTAKLTTLLQSAHKVPARQPERPGLAVPRDEAQLVEDVNNIVEQLDARVHLRSRYSFSSRA